MTINIDVPNRAFSYDGIGERHPCSGLPGIANHQGYVTKDNFGPSHPISLLAASPKYAPDAPGKPMGCQPLSHNTYLHAGSGKRGWPYDHSVDDAYECPPFTWAPTLQEAFKLSNPVTIAREAIDHALMGTGESPIAFAAPEDTTEYRALFGEKGEAYLVLVNIKRIAKFDTFADAQTAAKALNEHHGF